MAKKGIIISLSIALVAGIVLFLFWRWYDARDQASAVTSFAECEQAGYPILESYPRQCVTPDGRTFTEQVQNGGDQGNTGGDTPDGDGAVQAPIRIDAPQANATVGSPVTVRGQARGPWYFEASFPIYVVDANNKVIGSGYAEAKGDWMTTEYVPFEGRITFSTPTTQTGYFVFEKSNPSDLPQNSAEVRVPVRFSQVNEQPPETLTVNVYFPNDKKLKSGQDECNTVFATQRTIPYTQTTARAAIQELLKGPTAQEKAAEFTTSLPAGAQVKSLTIENGVAKVDFTQALQTGVGGSCRVTSIRKQIEETLKQFPSVERVEISVAGKTEDVLQP